MGCENLSWGSPFSGKLIVDLDDQIITNEAGDTLGYVSTVEVQTDAPVSPLRTLEGMSYTTTGTPRTQLSFNCSLFQNSPNMFRRVTKEQFIRVLEDLFEQWEVCGKTNCLKR